MPIKGNVHEDKLLRFIIMTHHIGSSTIYAYVNFYRKREGLAWEGVKKMISLLFYGTMTTIIRRGGGRYRSPLANWDYGITGKKIGIMGLHSV